MSHVNNVPENLPSSRTLVRSTLIAVGVAAVLLVGVVLPAEYGVDPVGVGRVLGLTEMGKIKMALAREADAAAAAERAAVAQAPAVPASPTRPAGDSAPAMAQGAASPALPRRDSTTVTLRPGASIELKLDMRKDQRATYQWRADSAAVNYNTHGEPPNPPKGFYHGYGKGTSRGEQGELVAAFDGMHGWFWRNRSAGDVRITLVTSGEYQELKELK